MNQEYDEQRRIYFGRIPQLLSETYQQPWSTCIQYETPVANKIANLCNSSAHSLATALGTVAGRLAHGEPLDNICADEMLPYYRRQSFPRTPVGGKASGIADMMVLVASVHPDQFAQYAGGQVKNEIVSHLNGTLHAWLLELQKQWHSVRKDVNADRTIFEVQIPPPEKEKATLGTMFAALGEALCIGQPRPSPFIDGGARLFAERFSVKLWPSSEVIESSHQHFKCVAAELSAQFQEWYFTVGKTNIRQRIPKESRSAEDAFVRIRDILHRNASHCNASASEVSCAGECMVEVYSDKSQSAEQFTKLCRSTIQIMHRRLLHSNITRH